MICQCVSKTCFVPLCSDPIFDPGFDLEYLSHNSIKIKCNLNKTNIVWNGGEGKYKAEIQYNGRTIKTSNEMNHCLFTFEDLHYLTTYNIKVLKSCLMSFSICHSCIPKSHMQ